MNSPFTDDDGKTVEEGLKLVSDLIPFIQKMESCGNDCDEMKERLETYRTRLEAYKREFFQRKKK